MPDENNQEQGKKVRFDEKQYELLKKCSENKDLTEWNEWREANRDTSVLLESADLSHAHLETAKFKAAIVDGATFI